MNGLLSIYNRIVYFIIIAVIIAFIPIDFYFMGIFLFLVFILLFINNITGFHEFSILLASFFLVSFTFIGIDFPIAMIVFFTAVALILFKNKEQIKDFLRHFSRTNTETRLIDEQMWERSQQYLEELRLRTGEINNIQENNNILVPLFIKLLHNHEKLQKQNAEISRLMVIYTIGVFFVSVLAIYMTTIGILATNQNGLTQANIDLIIEILCLLIILVFFIAIFQIGIYIYSKFRKDA